MHHIRATALQRVVSFSKKRMLSDYLCPGKMRQTLTRFCSRGLRGKNDDACDDISYNSAADAVSPTKSPAM